jgi:hypothetical protein
MHHSEHHNSFTFDPVEYSKWEPPGQRSAGASMNDGVRFETFGDHIQRALIASRNA